MPALAMIFNTSVVEKGVAVITFRTLRWLSSKTTNDIDDDVVSQMEIAYYGEERYAKVPNAGPASPVSGPDSQAISQRSATEDSSQAPTDGSTDSKQGD